MSHRPLQQIVHGLETADGAGVRLTRLIGGPQLPLIDPFLLFDHFHSDDPDDYIGGFPAHPHRGFETVTYLLAGRMRHKDSAGNEGVLQSGGVQWMTAGRGVIHSEMPEQEEGHLSGFQLWLNLPAQSKMIAPRYQEFGADKLPVEARDGGVRLRVIAGTSGHGTEGPVGELVTPACYYDIELPAGGELIEPLPVDFNAFVFVVSGEVEVGGQRLLPDQLGVLGDGDAVAVRGLQQSRLLLIGGRPLREPVARRGPFVMNSDAELRQAFRDYQEGRFA